MSDLALPTVELEQHPLADVIRLRGDEPDLVPVELEDVPAHEHTLQECSPLWAHYGDPSRWTPGVAWAGEIVTDPQQIAAIRRRVEGRAGNRRGAWRRTLRRIRRGQ